MASVQKHTIFAEQYQWHRNKTKLISGTIQPQNCCSITDFCKIVSTSCTFAIKEPGIDTKSVPGLFFICWDISVCFGDILFIFAQKY